MQFEKGQVYDFDGKKRLVIGFDGNDPITTSDLAYKENADAAQDVDAQQLSEQLAKAMQALETEKNENDQLREQLADVQAQSKETDQCRRILGFVPLDKCNKDQLAGFAKVMGATLPDEMDKEQMIQAVKRLM